MLPDVQRSQATSLVVRPEALLTAPSAAVYSPSGSLLESPTPSVDTTSTTVASDADNTAYRIKLASASGVARGRLYQVTDPVWGVAYAEVASVDSATEVVTLVEALPAAPATGATFKGVEVTVAVAAIATLGVNYRLVITEGTFRHTEVFHVVREPFRNPVTSRRVRQFLSDHKPSEPLLRSEESLANVAESAGKILRGRFLERDVYPNLYWSADIFEEATLAAMELALAHRGVYLGEGDKREQRDSLSRTLGERVGAIASASHPYDADEDGAIDADEKKGPVRLRLRR